MADNTALLVIDMQNALVESAWNAEQTIDSIRTLIERARQTDTPIIFIQHETSKYPPMSYGADGWQIHPALTPAASEVAIRKRAADSFYETELQDALESRGIKQIIVSGMQTECCVDTTCRAALSRGFDVLLAADAHTTEDNDMFTAAQMIAFTNHALSMVAHPDHQIVVQPTSEIAF
jgi:nicotinamidase-related amidase